MGGRQERCISSRDDIDFIIKELEQICDDPKKYSLDELLIKLWGKQQIQADLNHDNPIRNMPVVSKRNSCIQFGIYKRTSPDRDLQLAIALIKSIMGDYDKLTHYAELGYRDCPKQILDTELCTILARKFLSVYNILV